ncbi:hypothetical protein HWV62_36167 [Athelia sp. TMB]|nr:hypothetical protein HWV62_36167 [Athelia sp. TMB]
MNISATLLAIFNRGKIIPSPQSHFYKSQLFISPDSSQLPDPEEVFKKTDLEPVQNTPATGRKPTFSSEVYMPHDASGTRSPQAGATDFPGKQTMHRLLSMTPPPIHTSQNVFSLPDCNQTPSDGAALSPVNTLNGTDNNNQSTRGCADNSDTAEDFASLRLSGEKLPHAPRPESMLTVLASIRMNSVAKWVGGYIYGVIATRMGFTISHSYKIRMNVSNRIYRVLESTALPPATVFMALWFIEQLPFTFGDTHGSLPRLELHRILYDNHSGIEELIFKAFLVGAMLANKGNDDHCLTSVEW